MTLATVNEPIVITQFQVLLGDIKEARENAVESFDYSDPKGDKAARSYIFGLRKVRARIESCRKDAKSYALAYGKRVDEQAKDLMGQIDGLIQPHQLQLEAIARQEAERVASHQEVLDSAIRLGLVSFDQDSSSINAQLKELDGITIDGLQEFSDKVAAAIVQSRQSLQQALTKATEAEAQAAELARLRQEAEARERQERQERIEREAKEKAEREAEAAAQEAIQEAERRVAEAEARAEAAEAEAKRKATAAEELARRQAEDERERKEAAAAPAPSSALGTLSLSVTDAVADKLRGGLVAAMNGMRREDVAEAIVRGRLHPAIAVDWSKA